MKNRKIRLIEYLKSLDSKELNRFSKLVSATYFNDHEGTKAAFGNIYYCISNKKSINRKTIFEAVYPNESYDSQKVSNILTYLMRLFETFIQDEYQPQLDFSKLSLLSFLAEKRLDTYFDRTAAAFHVEDKHPITSFYTYQFIEQYQLDKRKRTDFQSLQQSNMALDAFYFKEKFKAGCRMLSYKNVVSGEFNFMLFDQFEEQLKSMDDLLNNHLLLKLYFLSYQMIKYDTPEIYQEIKTLLIHTDQKLDIEEQKDLYGYLQNFTIKQINKGNREFLSELFDIYMKMLENGVIYTDGYLSEWKYKNIITAGCRLNKMEWTRQFIEDYKERIKPSSRENAYKFNLASYYNFIGNHNETLNVLRDVQFSDIYYHLDTNVLLIKTYFALDEHELLLNLLDTFRIFILRNNKVSTYQKKLYKNLIKYTRQLSLLESKRAVLSSKEYEREKLKVYQQVSSRKNTIAIDWLLGVSGSS